MLEYFVLRTAWTVLSALMATIGWNTGLAGMRASAMKKGKTFSEGMLNAQLAIGIIMIALLPEPLLVWGFMRKHLRK